MKMFTKTAIIALVFLIGFHIVSAAYGQVFGSKNILRTISIEVKIYEDAGYNCDDEIIGQTITVLPIRGPAEYIIPHGVVSRTRFSLSEGQKIIGRYGGTTTITCIYPSDPPVVHLIFLPTVTLFGNSKI